MTALLLAYLKTGLLVSLAVVGLLLALPLLDRRYTARWRCRVWVALAVLLLLPLPSLPGRAALRLTLPETAAEPLAGPLFSALPGGGRNLQRPGGLHRAGEPLRFALRPVQPRNAARLCRHPKPGDMAGQGKSLSLFRGR